MESNDTVEILQLERKVRQQLVGPNRKELHMTYDERMVLIRITVRKDIRRYLRLLKRCSQPIEDSIAEFHQIANDLDTFHKRTTIASVSSGAVCIAAGITTIVGLILIPFTFGASIIVTGVGIGVGAAGGLAGAAANVADIINARLDRRKVEERIKTFQNDLEEMNACLQKVQRLDGELSDLMRLHDHNEKLELEQVILKGEARVINTVVGAVRLSQVGRIAGIAARGAKIATAMSGVLAGLVIVIDTALLVKDAKDLHKGAKSESGTKIREKANELNEILQTLRENGEEMRSAASNNQEYSWAAHASFHYNEADSE